MQLNKNSVLYMNHYTKTKKFGFKNLENKSIFDFDVIQLCESYACIYMSFIPSDLMSIHKILN